MNEEELQTFIYKVTGWKDRAEADYEHDHVTRRFHEGKMIAFAKVIEELEKYKKE